MNESLQRALNAVKAQGLREAAEAWDALPESGPNIFCTVDHDYVNFADWLRNRADQVEMGQL